MASESGPSASHIDIDPSHVKSARILEEDPATASDTAEGATDKDTVQLVLSLPREEAQRLANRLAHSEGTSTDVSAPLQETEEQGPSTRLRTSSRTRASDANKGQESVANARTTRSSGQGSGSSASVNAPPQPQPANGVEQHVGPATIEYQGFLDTERSYTNAFHKTLSLFVDDKTFSTPSLRAAVVGFLESSNATVLESLPHHDNAVPEYLRQEIDNHVNLVKTVLQRGGVFAEDFLRARLKKLAAHLPRIESALSGGQRSGKTHKPPVLVARAGDTAEAGEISPNTLAANQAALAHAAEAAERVNNRHLEMINANGAHGMDEAMMGMNGFPNGPPTIPGMPPIPGQMGMHMGMPGPQLPPVRGKTFVPPNLVPSQPAPGSRAEDGGSGSPPPVLAPFDPRPNPMACLFCRQRKIRCIGHKPHPCEICVKRGFQCSYDWISRRGKRKPKNSDGSPMDMPSGGVGLAISSDEQGHGMTMDGESGSEGHSAAPQVGIHQHPGMHPGMPVGGIPQPGQEGVTFAYHFLPGHPGFPPHMMPPPNMNDPNGSGAMQGMTDDENAMMIDPNLMSTNLQSAGSALPSSGAPCTFCKEQELECGGSAPKPCANCQRRNVACQYPDTPSVSTPAPKSGKGGRKKKRNTETGESLTQAKKQKVVDSSSAEGEADGLSRSDDERADVEAVVVGA